MRSKEEIDDQLSKADEQVENGNTTVRGMTYEEGVAYALRWATGDSNDAPMED